MVFSLKECGLSLASRSLCILWRTPHLLFFLCGRLYPCMQETTRSQGRASIPSTVTLGFWDKTDSLSLFSMLLQQDSCEMAENKAAHARTLPSFVFYYCSDGLLTSAPVLYDVPMCFPLRVSPSQTNYSPTSYAPLRVKSRLCPSKMTSGTVSSSLLACSRSRPFFSGRNL